MLLGKAFSVSMLNQLVSSGTNFAIILYLVRVMEKSDFGLYSLGFALMLLLAGLISSSIAVQFVVNLPDQPQAQRAEYALSHAVAVFVLGVAMTAMAALISTVPLSPIIGDAHTPQIILPLVAAGAFYSLRDLLMRVAYAERRESVVLMSTLAATAGTAAALIYYWQAHYPLTAVRALLALAAGQVAGSLAGLAQLRLPYRSFNVKGVRRAFSDSWAGGRWNILTNIVYNLRSQAHNFVVAPLLGMAALAEVNAARLLVTPAVMTIPPLTQVLMPRLAAKREQGTSVIAHYALFSVGGLSAFALLYSALLLTLLPWALPLTLGEAYQHIGILVGAWCLVAVVLALRNGLTMVLQVVRAFRDLLFANAAAAVVAILLAVALTFTLGSLGAIIAVAIAEIVLSIFLVKLLRARLATRLGGDARRSSTGEASQG